VIKGVGIDVVEVVRIERAMQNPRFVMRVLTEKEREGRLDAAFVAGRWAAKEAVAKATGVPMSWQDVEIVNVADGTPKVVLRHNRKMDDKTMIAPSALFRAEQIAEEIHISISHERGIAAAIAIWEG
jgi:holo-[acyl-carrier protein] synthase